MVIQHNMQAMNSSRMLGVTTSSQGKVTEKLSSGYKINRAADDAAGLSISEKMRKQIRGLDRASTNAQDGVSCVQTAEGALNEVHSMLQRMNELAVQSANGTNSQTDRDALQAEIDQLVEEIDRVSETTKFNETYLLKGDATAGTKDVYTYKSVTTPASFSATGKTYSDFYAEGATAAYANEAALLQDLKDGKKIYSDAQSATTQDAADKLTKGTEYSIVDATFTNGGSNTGQVTAVDNTKAKAGSYTYNGTEWVDDADPNVKYTSAELGLTTDGNEANNDKVTLTAASVTKTGVTSIYAENGATALTDAEIIAADAAGEDLYKTAAITSQTEAVAGTDYTYTPGSKGMAKLYDKNGEAVAAKDISKLIEDGETLYTDAEHTDAVTNIEDYTNKETVNEALSLNLHVGADSAKTNKISLTLESMSAAGIGVKGLKIDTEDDATNAIDIVADALQRVSEQRSALGAIQNRLEHTIANLDNVVENTTSAESRIRDVDMADAMVEYSKNNILQQAGQSMLAQANQANQGVLSLLQ